MVSNLVEMVDYFVFEGWNVVYGFVIKVVELVCWVKILVVLGVVMVCVVIDSFVEKYDLELVLDRVKFVGVMLIVEIIVLCLVIVFFILCFVKDVEGVCFDVCVVDIEVVCDCIF